MVGIGTRLGLSKLSGRLYEKILGTESNDLIAYWPMDEASGVTADNAEGTAARDGTYNGVTLGQTQAPFTAPLFDGANDSNNIYTASLVSAFSGAAGTAMLFAKVSGPGVLTDSTMRAMLYLQADTNNRVRLEKTLTDNRFYWLYRAGSTNDGVTKDIAETGWFHFAFTWDAAADEVKAYWNGVQEGSTQTGLGTWAGSLGVNSTIIGASSTVPANVWDGYLAHCAIWTKALTAAQILAIYQASGVA